MPGVDTVQPAAYGASEEGQIEQNEAVVPKLAVENLYTAWSMEYPLLRWCKLEFIALQVFT